MGFVDYRVEGVVGVITINREKALNALSGEVMNDLEAVIEGVDTEAVRAVIVTGAGQKSFVAGADIGSMEPLSKAEGVEWGKHGSDVFRKLELLPVPVIAAVNGFALGGGCELAMSCDIRICSENAIFGQPEVGLGIIPGFGGTQRLARLIGPGMAKQLIYTGFKIKAPEALRIGLVNAVYPQESLMDEAMKLANAIAKQGQNAVNTAKKAIDEGLELSLDDALTLEHKLFGDCFERAEQKDRMAAFLKK